MTVRSNGRRSAYLVRHSGGAAVTLPGRISRANLLHMNTADYFKMRITQNHFLNIEMAMLRDVNCVVHESFEGRGQKLRFEESVSTIEGYVR